MAKKLNKETVEDAAPKLPSDLIVAGTDPTVFDPTEDVVYKPVEPVVFVTAVQIPEKPKVDVNKVLFEMIGLMGTVESFDSQARILRAVAAYYNLTEDMS